MISLTDQLDNIVYVNPRHIVAMKVCPLNQICDLTEVNCEKKVEEFRTGFTMISYLRFHEHELGVILHLVTGKTLIVKECLKDIKNLLIEFA